MHSTEILQADWDKLHHDDYINPSNAEATFFQGTRMQKSLKNIKTLAWWYSLDSSHWVLSDE